MIGRTCCCWAAALLVPALGWADFKEALQHFKQGAEALEKRDYDRAIACFSAGIRLDPNNAFSYYYRGRAYTFSDYDRAIADFSQAIRLDPKNAVVYYQERGRAYLSEKDYDRAITDFSQIIHLDPKSSQAYADRGEAYAAKNETDRAVADYTKAIEFAPKDDMYPISISAQLYAGRGAVHEANKDYERAIADCSQAIRLASGGIYAYATRARAYAAKQEYDRAIADYREVIRLFPGMPSNYYSLAWLLVTCPKIAVRDGKQAVEYARKGLEVLPGWSDQEGFNALAAAYAETGDFKEAMQCMRKALRERGVLSKEEMRARLALYEQGKPFRETPSRSRESTPKATLLPPQAEAR